MLVNERLLATSHSLVENIQLKYFDYRKSGKIKSERVKGKEFDIPNDLDKKNAVEIDDEPINGEADLSQQKGVDQNHVQTVSDAG